MKKFAIGCFILLAGMCLLIGSCSYWLYRDVKNMPDYAHKEILYPNYKAVMTQVESTIAQSDTILQAAARLESAAYPQEILWIKLQGEDEKDIQAFRRNGESWSGKSSLVINGAGYGTLTDKNGDTHDVAIIDSDEKLRSGEKVTYWIYIDHPKTN